MYHSYLLYDECLDTVIVQPFETAELTNLGLEILQLPLPCLNLQPISWIIWTLYIFEHMGKNDSEDLSISSYGKLLRGIKC
jgi:hypothetical protein